MIRIRFDKWDTFLLPNFGVFVATTPSRDNFPSPLSARRTSSISPPRRPRPPPLNPLVETFWFGCVFFFFFFFLVFFFFFFFFFVFFFFFCVFFFFFFLVFVFFFFFFLGVFFFFFFCFPFAKANQADFPLRPQGRRSI